MTLAEQIYEEAKNMPEIEQRQILDFLLFLKQRDQQVLEREIDELIAENMEALKVLAQ
mgnify:FL=1